jgi:hypothetical protein
MKSVKMMMYKLKITNLKLLTQHQTINEKVQKQINNNHFQYWTNLTQELVFQVQLFFENHITCGEIRKIQITQPVLSYSIHTTVFLTLLWLAHYLTYQFLHALFNTETNLKKNH